MSEFHLSQELWKALRFREPGLIDAVRGVTPIREVEAVEEGKGIRGRHGCKERCILSGMNGEREGARKALYCSLLVK
jgi:hypothetical protein